MQREEGISHQLLQADVQGKQVLCKRAVLHFPAGQGGTESKLHLPAARRKFQVVGKRVGLGLHFLKTNSLNSSQVNKSYFDFILWHRFSLQAPEGKCLQVPSVRHAGIWSWKMQLGSCWVIGPITRAKGDRRYST